jgi:hypothetical protein
MSVDTKLASYPDSFAKYLRPTDMCNFDYGPVRKVANKVTKDATTEYQAITAVHEFVAALPLGFDSENWPAHKILRAQRGQCNTKTTLFITLLRCAGVACRVRAWKIHKEAHKDHFPALIYAFTPKETLFTYPEVYYKDKWMLLSKALYSKSKPDWSVCPFDDALGRTHPLKKEWVAEELGYFWHPDNVYEKYGTNIDGWRKLAFPIAQKILN